MSKIWVFYALICTSTACVAPKPASDTSSIVYRGARWKNPGAIPVCWENGNQVDRAILNDVKAKLISEFNKTAIGFTRFNNCTAADLDNTMVRVHFNLIHNWGDNNRISAGGGLSWIGPNPRPLKGTSANGTMRIDIGRSGKYPEAGNPMRQFAVNQTRGTIVHEMGHAVGLAHEHQRTDAPKCGDQQRQAENANFIYIGKYDPRSIMNYCKTNNIDSLTPGDIKGINFLYPKSKNKPKITYSPDISEPSQISKPSEKPAPGGKPEADTFNLFIHHSKQCLDIQASQSMAGAAVHQADCKATVSQNFRLIPSDDGTYLIENVSSKKCLAIGSLFTGAAVRLETCGNSDNQQLLLSEAAEGFYRMQFTHSNLCLAVEASSLLPSAHIVQTDCDADALNQEFSLSEVK